MDVINPVVRRWVREAREDAEAFWARAAQQLPWLRPWDRVLEWNFPTFRWFVGGQTNLAMNCLDRHVAAGRGGHAALVYVNERGERRVYTYGQLRHEVERAAAALRGLGMRKGDRLTIYMPTCPEAIILMLALTLGTGLGGIWTTGSAAHSASNSFSTICSSKICA